MAEEMDEAGRTSYHDERASVEQTMRDARDATADSAERAGERASEMADEARSKAGAAADRAMDAADHGRETTADALDRAASNIKDRAGDGMTGAAMGKAAGGMEAAAGYLKGHETNEIWDDLERYVRDHPLQAVAAAVATGIVVGRVLR
ncbi:MAG: hypothetical protein AB7L91_08845 [Dehalococcoidia bacterium]